MRGLHPAPSPRSNSIVEKTAAAEPREGSSSYGKECGCTRIEVHVACTQAKGLRSGCNCGKHSKALFSIPLPYPEAVIPKRFSLPSILNNFLHGQVACIHKRYADVFQHGALLSRFTVVKIA